MADHCAHVELFYAIWLDIAKGQLMAMRILGDDIPAAKVQADTLSTIVEDVENRLALCQNRDLDRQGIKSGTDV